MDKKIAKNISKSFSGKYIQKYLDLVKQSATDAFKTASKRAIQKDQKQLVIYLVIQRQLRMSMKKRYLKKDIHLQKNDKKLLMTLYWNNSILTKYQKIKEVSKIFQQNNSETVTNKNDK